MAKQKLSAFGAAFASARSSGKSVFTFGGKSYNTKVKGEGAGKSASVKSSKSKVPTPSASPRSASHSVIPSSGLGTKRAPATPSMPPNENRWLAQNVADRSAQANAKALASKKSAMSGVSAQAQYSQPTRAAAGAKVSFRQPTDGPVAKSAARASAASPANQFSPTGPQKPRGTQLQMTTHVPASAKSGQHPVSPTAGMVAEAVSERSKTKAPAIGSRPIPAKMAKSGEHPVSPMAGVTAAATAERSKTPTSKPSAPAKATPTPTGYTGVGPSGVGRGSHGAMDMKARVGFNTSTPAKPYEQQAGQRRANTANAADIARRKASMGPPMPTMAQKAASKSTVGKSPIAVRNQSKK